MKWSGISPLVLVASLGAILGCQSHGSQPASPPTLPAAPPALPEDGMVDVGNGVSLHVHCVGDGSPMVLVDECLGCQVPMYRPIGSAIGRFTRACGYDRAGVGYSTPAAKPHLARQVVGELHNLIGDCDASGAVVLVGHGLGGLFTQLYARAFPRSVAGMVLVDPQTADYDTRYYALYPPEARAAMKADLGTTPENLDPDDVFGAMADLRKAPLSLGGRPLVLVTRGKPREPLFDIPAAAWDKLEAAWRAMERDVTSLSTNSTHIMAPEAGWIPDDAPDRVVMAAWQVVSAVRSGVPVSRLVAKAPPLVPPLASADAAIAATTSTGHVADDRMVDMGGGMSLHLHCLGHGAPTVILENGHGADGGSWGPVLGDFGHLTRTCVYDRPGTGFSSSPAPKRHSNRQMAHELQALLERAAIPGPYVLVAHSMGGVNVRLFQAEHPAEVVGMVLVDVSNEYEPTDDNPDEIRALLRDDVEGVDYDTMLAGIEDLRASAARTLGDMPLVVLSANGKEPLPPQFAAEGEPAFRQKILAGHERLARLSTDSAHVVADHSGHFIQIDAPPLVVASVDQVVKAVRTHGRVDAKALEPFLHAGPFSPRE